MDERAEGVQVSELKSCPFCGSGVLYEGIHMLDGFEVPVMFCNGCKAMVTFEGFEDYVTDKSDGMAELRAAWNRRAEWPSELLPCPFCGGQAKLMTMDYSGGEVWGVFCVDDLGMAVLAGPEQHQGGVPMTATDELRALLDERGVEYYESPNGVAWGKLTTPIHGRMYTHYAVELDGLLCVDSHCITTAQVVEATLGRDEPPYGCLVERLREDWHIDASWDGLRRFWHIQLTEEGVRRRDEREASLGRGTCEMEYISDFMSWHCKTCDQMDMAPRNTKPRYCKWCGRKVVE